MSAYILLSHMKIRNANAMSSYYTVGFPAMTAWLGIMHALERRIADKLAAEQTPIKFTGLVVAVHDFRLHYYQGIKDNVLIGTANPVKSGGKRSAFIEEAKADLEVSLVVEATGVSLRNRDNVMQAINRCLPRLKAAGGDIIEVGKTSTPEFPENTQSERKLLRRLMPSYIIVERTDLMKPNEENAEADSMDRLLTHLAIHHEAIRDKADKITGWESSRKTTGWIVPIMVGYKAISEVVEVENQRSYDYPHRFAEAVVTLGEFIMPHRLNRLEDAIWRYEVDETAGLYLCRNNYQNEVKELD